MRAVAEKEMGFLQSALYLDSEIMPNQQLLRWIAEKKTSACVTVKPVPFKQLTSWHFDSRSGRLCHKTGRFFSIDGIRIQTNWGKIPAWDQPIINQPEIGCLGFIVKKFNGIYHFLIQAKAEPGNIDTVQISPTLQATPSNSLRVHKGRTPLYLDYFTGEKPCRILLDQLQSEQGARFLKKRNRNIIVEVETELPVYEDFCWVTLGQIKEMMQRDNLVNMDTRTVISGIQFGCYNSRFHDFSETLGHHPCTFRRPIDDVLQSFLVQEVHYHEIDDIISWITNLKTKYELNIEKIPLEKVRHWHITDNEIYHEKKKYFSVIGVSVSIANREIQSWCQPLVKSAQKGILAFIVKKFFGVYHFLVQAKLEAGNFDIIELSPTVQCLTGNYQKGKNEYKVPFLDQVLNAKKEQILYSANQSEEGGRFFQEQNRNMIIEAGPDFPKKLPDNYCWMTFNQLMLFIKFNNYLNISARSLISALRFTD